MCDLVEEAREGLKEQTRREMTVHDKEGILHNYTLVHQTRSQVLWSEDRDTTCLEICHLRIIGSGGSLFL